MPCWHSDRETDQLSKSRWPCCSPLKATRVKEMNIQLLEYFRSFLLHAPPYTSTFLVVKEWQEPVLVMRVEDLSTFRQGGYRARVGFQAWQNNYGTWVVAIPFCLEVLPTLKVKGMPCLNPRQIVDYEMVQKFSRKESIRFLFLNATLHEMADAEIPWPPSQRSRVRQLIRTMDQTLPVEKLTSAFDLDFEQARQEFQTLLTALELPDEVWGG
jgi:hypothetical protein